jgi:hypothetical protein
VTRNHHPSSACAGHHQLDKKTKNLPSLSEKLLPAQSEDMLELDELWSFVQKKAKKSWPMPWVGAAQTLAKSSSKTYRQRTAMRRR